MLTIPSSRLKKLLGLVSLLSQGFGSAQYTLPESHNDYGRMMGDDLGLNSSNLNYGGLAIGFLPGLEEKFSPNTPQEIEALLPAPMSIMGDYSSLETQDPNLSSVDRHLNDYLRLKGNPVWEIALMPNEGLENVTAEVAERIAAKMLSLNQKGITIWLRFSHEMNGDWYAWGQKPALFIEKWLLVARAVKAKTTKTYMLWAPNSLFGDSVDSTRGGYTSYWPGPETVDITGISFYHYGGFERNNVLPEPEEALQKIQQFAELFARPYNKSVVLAETGASYTVSIETGQPAPGGATNYEIKIKWLRQLLAHHLRKQVPEFKAFSWFEVLKHETAAGDSILKSEDFRLLLGEQRLAEDALKILRRPYREDEPDEPEPGYF